MVELTHLLISYLLIHSSIYLFLFQAGEIIDVKDLDIWDQEFEVKNYFDLSFLQYLKQFYDTNTEDNEFGLLSFSSFCKWNDIQQMLKDGEIDSVCLGDLWDEAIIETKKRKNGKNQNGNGQEMVDENENKKNGFQREKRGEIDFDTFSRMNVRLDVVLEELKDAVGALTDIEVEQYLRSEFKLLSKGEELITFNQLNNWSDLIDLLESEYLTKEQINIMWEALPKRPLSTIKKENDKNNDKSTKQSDGIDINSFIIFNEAMDDIDSEESTSALD